MLASLFQQGGLEKVCVKYSTMYKPAPASSASSASIPDNDQVRADTEDKPVLFDNKVPSLLSLSIDVVVRLIVTDTTRLMLTRIVQQLPISIASLILTELPPDLLFQYYVICNSDHFQALNWREFWSLQYARSLSKRKQENEDLDVFYFRRINMIWTFEQNSFRPVLHPATSGTL